MSHQSGIVADDGLRSFFASSKEGDVRLIKVAIRDEKLVLDSSKPPSKSWEDDYDALVLPMLEEKQPCYIFYRMDSSNDHGYEWIFILWNPDFSPVRQKMLYASTRSTLKTEFGGSQIKEEVSGSVVEDVSLAGYRRHLLHQDAPAPLTAAEEDLQEIKKNEVKTEIAVDTKFQTISGVHFPMSQDAQQKIEEIRDKQINYVQLSLDIKRETIELDNCDDTDVGRLPHRVPTDQPRYHLFTFKHTHEGDYLESIVFIYSMPGYKCSVKERMLYSSCKAPFTEVVEQMGVEIAKKIEIDDGNELTEEFLQDELHPKKNVARQKFAKPRGPGGRGPKRMTKQTNGNGSQQ